LRQTLLYSLVLCAILATCFVRRRQNLQRRSSELFELTNVIVHAVRFL
jgi:hypothetical protein